MKATIIDVQKNSSDFQHTQIDVIVEYEHEGFPADHHYKQGGKRQFIFTLPHEKFETLDEVELEKMVVAQGQEFVAQLAKVEVMATKESDLKTFIGREFNI